MLNIIGGMLGLTQISRQWIRFKNKFTCLLYLFVSEKKEWVSILTYNKYLAKKIYLMYYPKI